jgi:hypothetical protein
MPTTQLTPVGVGWGDYVIAWLLTYSGSDCELWQLVFRKCMGSELCRRLIELLLDDLAKHKCYVEDLDAEIIDQAPNHSHNNPNQPPQQHRTTRNHSNLKTKAPQLPKLSKSLSRPCPEPLPEAPQTHLSLSHTPHLIRWEPPPDRGPTEPGAAHRWGVGWVGLGGQLGGPVQGGSPPHCLMWCRSA